MDHIEARGVDLFAEVCRKDLENIVTKRPDGVLDPDAPTWLKIENPGYSQTLWWRERFGQRQAR